MRWLVNLWGNQQSSVSYEEIRAAVLSGEMSQEQLEEWQYEYTQLVNDKLAPQWRKAMNAAYAEKQSQFKFIYEPSVNLANDYVQQRGAEFVTRIVSSQQEAIKNMVARALYVDEMSPVSLSYLIRPVIGLTEPQAIANLNYYNRIKDELLKANPNMSESTAEKRARESVAKYAGRQHRDRALNIARTELATAYNRGAYNTIYESQEKGYIGDCRKTWHTSEDERVCPICNGVDGESVNMDTFFSIGVLIPPAHPRCRCAVGYEEIAEPTVPTEQSI